uniref:VapB-type antitoxin n=1 Tax=Ignisphaera aggregans TaxID=334771 RepID=A0A7C5Z046_9CREN
MKKYKYINWSEVVRQAIIERLTLEETREKMIRAVTEMNSIRNELLKKYGPTDYDSTVVIRTVINLI